MSLVGSLEDLGLGDILQIVSLSRKSGLLSLRSAAGEGRIHFHDGEIRAAFIKGEPEDLRGLLVDGGWMTAAEYDAVEQTSRQAQMPVSDALGAAGLSGERLDELRRSHVERVVVRMFGWRSGEFRFEIRDELDDRDGELALARGVNAQYLTMEATRLSDEGLVPEPEPEPQPEPEPEPVVTAQPFVAVEPIAKTEVARAVEPEIVGEAQLVAPAEPVAMSLVAIDADLNALEWVKSVLSERFARIHILQNWDSGVARIRQYLARGEVPLVLVSANPPVDPMSGPRQIRPLIRRLRAQAPQMAIVVMHEEPEAPGATGADALVRRPPAPHLANPRAWKDFGAEAAALRDTLARWSM